MTQARLLLALIAFLCCAHVRAAALKPVDDATARRLFEAYLKAQGQSPSDFGVAIKPFGKTTKFICAGRRDISPPFTSVYIMNSRGEIWPLGTDSLAAAYLNEFPSCPTEEDRRKLMESFIGHHAQSSLGARAIIRSTGDIPGYTTSRLDRDLEAGVCAPYSFRDNKDCTIHVAYTYQRIGGLVHRYRLRFSAKGAFHDAQCAELGRDVGDAQYLE